MSSFQTYLNDAPISVKQSAEELQFTIPQACERSYVEAVLKVGLPLDNLYVLFPACCYKGNQFPSLARAYPPKFTLAESKVDMPVTITDVPRLNEDGSGCIEITTGDLSVPCVGLFSPVQKRGFFLFTTQGIDGVNFGLSYQEGSVSITYPHMRKKKMYRWPFMVDSTDSGMSFAAGQAIVISYQIYEFDCADLPAFFHAFAEKRKCMGMDATYCSLPDEQTLWDIQETKYNRMNYRPEKAFYGVGVRTDPDIPTQTWQPGWVGGAMAGAALMKKGSELSFQRALSTLHYLFSTQTKAGFFEGVTDEHGNPFGDAFGLPGGERLHLVRKSADVLYFLYKHYEVMKEKGVDIPTGFLDGTRKLADGFVTLWNRYGQFGQFIDVDTGEIIVGGSTSAAMAPGALARSYAYFGNEEYLRVAKESAEFFYQGDVLSGYTTGGPGEILQGPDSESAFALLESFIALYEVTHEQKWLEYAQVTADFCSTWVVAYNYQFPHESEFGRLDMKTIGSVFANVQNKHSAPGICTLSGDCLQKLAAYTRNDRYLELYHDITKNILQYLSRPDRPIYSWDTPPQRLADGVMCERVNMSDWEDYPCVGGVFNGSCWCEVSAMLYLAGL